jgi:hypothetical protein
MFLWTFLGICLFILGFIHAAQSSQDAAHLGLKVDTFQVSVPGISTSVTCIIPPTAPSHYTCDAFGQAVQEVTRMFSNTFGWHQLSQPIKIEASFLPFCEEAVHAMDHNVRDTSKTNYCVSALSHQHALAFAGSSHYFEVKEKEQDEHAIMVPSAIVKHWSPNLAYHSVNVNLTYSEDVVMQVRSDWDRWWLPVSVEIYFPFYLSADWKSIAFQF